MKSGRLFLLEASGGRVISMNPDASDRKVIVDGRRIPDGVVVDVEAGHVFWTNMGNPAANDGSIQRADIDGRNLTTIVPEGGTFTPKQIQLDKRSGKLYWSDREGMRVMRANRDGSHVETLVERGRDDAARADQTARTRRSSSRTSWRESALRWTSSGDGCSSPTWPAPSTPRSSTGRPGRRWPSRREISPASRTPTCQYAEAGGSEVIGWRPTC